jgi:hypothetical protein
MAERTVVRLLKKGYPASKILRVVAEAFDDDSSEPCTTTVCRITNYEMDDNIQLVIGTPQVLSRLALSKDPKKSFWNKPPLVVIVILFFLYIF